MSNNIELNIERGIYLWNSSSNTILKNNFLDNQLHATFNDCKNFWKQNYWNRPRILPELIIGKIHVVWFPIKIPWLNFDWRPAKEPYDIEV